MTRTLHDVMKEATGGTDEEVDAAIEVIESRRAEDPEGFEAVMSYVPLLAKLMNLHREATGNNDVYDFRRWLSTEEARAAIKLMMR